MSDVIGYIKRNVGGGGGGACNFGKGGRCRENFVLGQKDNLDLLDSCDLKRIRKGGLDIRTRSMKVVGGLRREGGG